MGVPAKGPSFKYLLLATRTEHALFCDLCLNKFVGVNDYA